MARTIQVTPEYLVSAAKSIHDLANDYKAQYDQLYTKTGEMATSWKGKDNIAYIDQISGFKDDFGKMYELMLAYEDFLVKSADAYTKAQNTVVTEARKLVN